jgi:hypothetical protein
MPEHEFADSAVDSLACSDVGGYAARGSRARHRTGIETELPGVQATMELLAARNVQSGVEETTR